MFVEDKVKKQYFSTLSANVKWNSGVSHFIEFLLSNVIFLFITCRPPTSEIRLDLFDFYLTHQDVYGDDFVIATYNMHFLIYPVCIVALDRSLFCTVKMLSGSTKRSFNRWFTSL